MKATIRDIETLSLIRSADLQTYLRTHNWHEIEKIENGGYWIKPGTEGSLLVPSSSHVRDYPRRIAEVLATLELNENRSQLEILEDIAVQNADVVRPRLRGTMEDGTISLEQGMALHEKARDMMLAAACAAISPRYLFARRKPEQAMEYVKRARFGPAKRGSYIMTIISPVPPQIDAGLPDLFGNAPVIPDPFERKTVKTLAKALSALSAALPRLAVAAKAETLAEIVHEGVSAQLCEAIVGLHENSGNQGIDFSFVWSGSRSLPQGVSDRFSIQTDAIPVIRETARIFREIAPVENVEIVGTVVRLDRLGGGGDVTIYGVIEGRQRTVHIRLPEAEHKLAVKAYDERWVVVCSGKLVREGFSWWLQNPIGFRVSDELKPDQA